MGINREKLLVKDFAVKNYVYEYYKKLKKSLPKKITNGEIEWIYSYGDKLLKSGRWSIMRKINEIAETTESDNLYIDPYLLYDKCRELQDKYKLISWLFRYKEK